ncbi:MAG: hypothetical protein JKY43_02645 [Phycisphaerales bacterium]|nr:hypothetical protein [Phycisphaerales bacterium]
MSPSSRDSISGWLDVLTSMLSISEPKRLQVRDELEDHLRSRVDDLLITGTPEHEAIRIAVAELGETAELAQLISHAHTRANPRRRMMNIALITAAVAGLSIGGYSMQNTAGTVVGERGSALVFTETSSANDEKVHAFDLGMASVSGILNEIGKEFDRSVSFSRGAVSPENRMYMEVHSQFAGQFTFDQAIQQFRKQFDEVSYGYNLEITADSVLYQTVDEYLRKQIQTRVYASPFWTESWKERYEYTESLTNLLKVKHDLTYTSIEVVDQAIIVAAPPEIQGEVVRLAAELDVIVEQRRAVQAKEWAQVLELREAESEQRALVEKEKMELKQAQHDQAVQRIQAEFSRVRGHLLATKAKLGALQNELESKNIFDPNQTPNPEFSQQVQALSQQIHSLMFEIDEIEERYMYLRTRLLESEYANLFEGLE